MFNYNLDEIDDVIEFVNEVYGLNSDFYEEYQCLHDLEQQLDELGARVYQSASMRNRIQDKINNLVTWF